MSQYTPEQRRQIMANARADLAGYVPAAQREAAVSRATGPKLVYKTRDDARVADDDNSASVERTLPTRRAAAVTPPKVGPSETRIWWEWVQEHVEHRICELGEQVTEATGGAMAEYVASRLDPVQRDLELTRRELAVLRQEVAVERGLKALREEVAEAQKQVPKFPAIASRLEAEQARLERELAATKDRLGKLRVNQSITDYNLGEMRKQVVASAGASIEMEFESTSSHFQMKANHPDAARALKEFATGIINGQADGTVWLPGAVGTA